MPRYARRWRRRFRSWHRSAARSCPSRLPHTEYAIPAYYIVATAEASANLARYDGVRYGFRARGARTLGEMYRETRECGFGMEVKRRIMLGTYALSAGYYDAYYLKAQKVRTLLTRDFDEAFKQVDVIAAPTAPTAAFKLGEKVDDPLAMYLADIYTVTANLAGIPGISVPCGERVKGCRSGCRFLGGTLMRRRCCAWRMRMRGRRWLLVVSRWSLVVRCVP